MPRRSDPKAAVEAFKTEVLNAMRNLQKRKGVTTRRIVKYLVDYCSHRRDRSLCRDVRKVLKKVVRRGEAVRDGLRYKLLKKNELTARTRTQANRHTRMNLKKGKLGRSRPDPRRGRRATRNPRTPAAVPEPESHSEPESQSEPEPDSTPDEPETTTSEKTAKA